MSYNSRRSANFGSNQQHQNASSVGQRRPVVTNNFVPGGQLAGSPQQQKPTPPQTRSTAQQQQQAPPQQGGINFRNQAGQTGQQNYQTQNYSTQPPQQQTQVQQQVQQQAKQDKPPALAQNKPEPTPAAPAADPSVVGNGEENAEGDGTKKRWFKFRGRVTKAEKVRRRNMKLSKILQPKNAVTILNELIRGCKYNVEELPCKIDANQFRASVVFEGQDFVGAGRTKTAAKNSAAETALKFLIKNKQLKLKKEEDTEGGDEKMEITEEDDSSQVMPWTHIASFAMYKLFSSWGEDTSVGNRSQEILGALGAIAKPVAPPTPARVELKPCKKLPDNPEKVNPLMLMNQMLPHAQWEEVGKSGVAPNVVFTFRVTVDGKQYTGTGSSKKTAKKLAAFAACHDILNIQYPADVWVPLY